MKAKIPHWLLFSVLAMLMNGIWGALVEIPEKRFSPPFPATLGYIVWSLTFIPCSIYLLYRINWKVEYSLKSDPKYLGIDVLLDEESWRAHIRETLEATKGVFSEFIIRDVYTVYGNLNKVRRSIELAKEEIARKRGTRDDGRGTSK